MEPVNLGHSVKDIPVPNKKLYMKMMINSTERFIQNLRWMVIFFLNPKKKLMSSSQLKLHLLYQT